MYNHIDTLNDFHFYLPQWLMKNTTIRISKYIYNVSGGCITATTIIYTVVVIFVFVFFIKLKTRYRILQ